MWCGRNTLQNDTAVNCIQLSVYCNQLNAFLNQVNAKQTNGQLTPQQAADLSQQAKAIQQAIGCSNGYPTGFTVNATCYIY